MWGAAPPTWEAYRDVAWRVVSLDLELPDGISPELALLARCPEAPARDLLFFDLETTGLGGAGTVAFLGAIGRFRGGRLEVTQYLLLDYPGEVVFLEKLCGEFAPPAGGAPPLVVTYNGKSFDAQVLAARCLINGLVPPELRHADLLHPARRLWKKVLPDCAQATIETAVLGLDRSGDTPGALAPEIWFSFLASGESGPLLDICDHNLRDIRGLAALLAALGDLARDPAGRAAAYRVDLEALALALNHEGLLREAASRGYPRAAFLWGRALLRGGDDGGRAMLERLAGAEGAPGSLRAAALRALAIDAEWQRRDFARALGYTEAALALGFDAPAWRRRCDRLLGGAAAQVARLGKPLA